MNITSLPAVRRLAMLYGTTPTELHRELKAAAARLAELADQIRPGDLGAADRAERFAEHSDALRRQAMLLRERLHAVDDRGGPPDAG